VKDRVWNVAGALEDAARLFGDELETVHNALFDGPADDVDVACTWGVVGNAKAIVAGYLGAGKRALMFDKALIRRLGNERQGHFRVGIDGPSPLKYLMRTLKAGSAGRRIASPSSRAISCRQHRPRRDPLRRQLAEILRFLRPRDANDYAERVFDQIREITKKTPLVYRPKPSWPGAREIAGTRLSARPLQTVPPGASLMRELKESNVLITHGSRPRSRRSCQGSR